MTQIVEKKINDNHIIWFEQSNKWIQLEEHAWFVNKLYQKGIDIQTISRKCAQKYNLPALECLRFVQKICSEITELSKPFPVCVVNFSSIHLTSGYSFNPYSTRNYLIGKKRFALHFETRLVEYYIHPTLAHLETDSSSTDVEFEIYNHGNNSVLMEKNRPETAYTFDDFIRLKKRLYINMVNIIYQKTNNDWLSFVHASAMTDGKQAILLSSASGSGKSSMAALLQTKGLQLISDDFVPIDAKNKQAYPFPAAISVKEGAFDLLSPYYGDLHDINYNKYEYTHRSVRYLTPKPLDIKMFKARPVKCIVYIRYNPSVSCNFKHIPSNEALKLFHEQAWVSGNPEHTKAFINWFVKLQCFTMEYGDTEKGINTILGLFKGK